MQSTHKYLVLAIVAVTAVGCQQNTDRVPDQASEGLAVPDTSGVAASATMSRDSLAGTLAGRAEPQQFFNEARAAFASNDRPSAVSALRQGAAYFRQVTDTANAQVRGQLSAVEQSLSSLADRMEGTASISLRDIDRVFVSANLAEAERHQVLSAIAWERLDSLRTGEELVMAVDHLERAAKDARLSLDANATRELIAARQAGTALFGRTSSKDGVPVPRAQRNVGEVIRDVRARSSR